MKRVGVMKAGSVAFGVLFLAGLAVVGAQQKPQAHGNMLQMMRGIVYPASNVVFVAQDDPATVKPADDPSTSPNPLASSYGQWLAVENAGVALAESANLLTIPRACSNGRQAPVTNADWQKFVQGLRDAGMTVLKAAQTKNVDRITEAADAVASACGNCHDVYREKTPQQGGVKARCTAS
ncbi:MAG: hypothetical protein FJW14_14295 [Acidimicrobiia bacterium]|nr:hypothetical protein [Acidimicrobiia bacterium]